MEISQRAVKELIKHFTGQAQMLTIPRPFIRLTGDHECALMLNQIIYWSERTDDPEGWFYKTHPDWAEELELTPAQVRRITKALEPLGVETKLKKHRGAPKLHYRINEEIFHRKLLEFFERQSKQGNIKKSDYQQSSQSELSDPITNIPDNQQSSLSESSLCSVSDSEQPSLSSSKDTKITTETTPEITHTHGARAPAAGGVCVSQSKFSLDERQRYADNNADHRGQKLGPGWVKKSADGSSDHFIEKWLREQSPQASAPERDISACPDCKGKGFYYPAGDTPEGWSRGTAKCAHPRLSGELERLHGETREELLSAK